MRPSLVFALAVVASAPFAAVASGSAQTDTTAAPVAGPSPAPTTSTSIAFPADPATRSAMLGAFDELMVSQRRIVGETRSAMLSALTQAHRAFVASLVGGLATAPSPDPVAAARQIDATLSLGERLGVMRADADRRARERELMTRISADLMARMTPDERAAVQQRAAQAQADAMRLTPAQRAALIRDAKTYVGTIVPGTAALDTPQTAGELVLRALTATTNANGL